MNDTNQATRERFAEATDFTEMMFGVTFLDFMDRLVNSSPAEAIDFLYGDTHDVQKIKKALRSVSDLSAKDWAELPLTLNPRQAATLLAVSPEKVRGWIKRGELKASDLGNGRSQFVIGKEDLEDFMKSRQPSKPDPQPRRWKRKGRAGDRY